MANDNPQKDMDFLLEFREFKGIVMTKLDRAIGDINELKNNIVSRVEDLEKDHVGREEFDKLLQWRWYIAGVFAVLVAILTLIVIPNYKTSEAEHKDINSRLQTVENKLK